MSFGLRVRFPVRLSIGEALAGNAFDRRLGPLRVVNPECGPAIVPEMELGRVAVKVRLGNVKVRAENAALEDREDSSRPCWCARTPRGHIPGRCG